MVPWYWYLGSWYHGWDWTQYLGTQYHGTNPTHETKSGTAKRWEQCLYFVLKFCTHQKERFYFGKNAP